MRGGEAGPARPRPRLRAAPSRRLYRVGVDDVGVVARHRVRGAGERHPVHARPRDRDLRRSSWPDPSGTSGGSGTPWCGTWGSSSSSRTSRSWNSRGVEWATWFVGGTINLAHQCVDLWAERTPGRARGGLGGRGRRGPRASPTAELREHDGPARATGSARSASGRATRWASSCRWRSRPSPRVMACSKIGAIWVPIFSGFGPDAVAARLADAGREGADHRGRVPAEGPRRPDEGDRRRAADAAGASSTSCLAPAGRSDAPRPRPATSPGRSCSRRSRRASTPSRSTASTRCSSATRAARPGKPKGVAARPRRVPREDRRGGRVPGGPAPRRGAPLGHGPRLDHGALGDRRGAGARARPCLLTEGAPTHPGPDRLWATVERHGVTTLGVSPTLIRALIPAGRGTRCARTICRRCGSSPRPASRGTPTPYRWLLRRGRRRPLPDHQPLRRHRGRSVLPLAVADHAR